jgi:hypothetical protein
LDVVPVVPPPHALKTRAISTDDVNQVNKRISNLHYFYQSCNGMTCLAQSGGCVSRLNGLRLEQWGKSCPSLNKRMLLEMLGH